MESTRYLEKEIKDICFDTHKMAFISGPRQCGKTTFAKSLLKARKQGQYYNWDDINFRRLWAKNPSSSCAAPVSSQVVPLIVYDEIHKAKLWKRSLKGVYDTLEFPVDIIVTGSAKLNIFRRGSDSLLGRYYSFRLHPFSLGELLNQPLIIPHQDLIDSIFEKKFPHHPDSQKILNQLLFFGPFPEPFLSGSVRKLNLWQRGRVEKLIREDLRDLSRLPELSQIEMLTALLPERVASILSIRSLCEDLEVAYTTMRRWLNYLGALYYHFELKPYSKNIARSVKKEGKLYLWDWSQVENEGARFENLVALHLLKYVHYLTDSGYGDYELKYLRNRRSKEIDFLIVRNKQPILPIEVKASDEALSKNWGAFLNDLPIKRGIQLVKTPGIYKVHHCPFGDVLVISADRFLACLV